MKYHDRIRLQPSGSSGHGYSPPRRARGRRPFSKLRFGWRGYTLEMDHDGEDWTIYKLNHNGETSGLFRRGRDWPEGPLGKAAQKAWEDRRR